MTTRGRKRRWVWALLGLALLLPVLSWGQDAKVLQQDAGVSAGTPLAIGQATLASIQVIASGSFNRTITFQASLDGVSYTTVGCTNESTLATETTATASGFWSCPVLNKRFLAAPITGGSAGTATVLVALSAPTINPYAVGGGGSSGGAPTDAKYITQTANSTLTAEQSLGALTTGLTLNTVTGSTGVLSTFVPSGACTTGQHVSALNASGATTCTADAGAPTDAPYITQTAVSGLSAEQSLGALTTGLVLNTVTGSTGVLSAFVPSAPCSSGQHISALSASGAATCTADSAGSGSPGGSAGQVQWNNTTFAGTSGLTVDATTVTALTAKSTATIDLASALHTYPIQAVLTSAIPVTCTANKETIIVTDAAQGLKFRICNSSGNGWITEFGGLGDPGANGLAARTSAGVSAARTITGTLPIVVANGDGVSGNPAISFLPTARTTTLSSSTTYTCNSDNADVCEMAMTGGAGTVAMAITGTPTNNRMLRIAIKCTSAQTLDWTGVALVDSLNVSATTACPADTTKWTEIGLRYSTVLTKWQTLATN